MHRIGPLTPVSARLLMWMMALPVLLAVELTEASTGASIWSTSASGTNSVGHVSMFSGRKFDFDAQDPETAYSGLVNTLVEVATRDFRSTWERR